MYKEFVKKKKKSDHYSNDIYNVKKKKKNGKHGRM